MGSTVLGHSRRITPRTLEEVPGLGALTDPETFGLLQWTSLDGTGLGG